jgi:outer membrane receptor protein involved in Fe transport
LSAVTALAQRPGGGSPGAAQGSVSGIVVDGATGTPLPVATVAIRSSRDSSLVTGTLAAKDGSFSASGLRPGRYYARISYVGYATRFIDIAITPGSPQVDLGKVELSTDASVKPDVVVSAQREFMTVAIDRTIYRTADMPVVAGGSATDVLRNVPQVDVDIDGNVSLRGSQNVVIQINGRPSMLSGQQLTNFLQGLPANSIERIEVIPNPSAKYDPDGMSGIINIVLKQETNRGLSGGINGSIGTRNNYNIGGNISYGQGPWNIYANYGFNLFSRQGAGTRSQQNLLVNPPNYLDQLSSDTNRWISHVLNGSVEYAFDQKNSLALNTMLNLRGGGSSGLSRYFQRNVNRDLTSRYNRSTDDDRDGLEMEYRLSYRWIPEATKHELSAELRYGVDNDDETGNYLQQDLNLNETPMNATPLHQQTKEKNDERGITLQVDYTRQLWEGARLEAGYKGESEKTSSSLSSESFDYTSGAFLPDTSVNNTFDYDKQIHAVYTNIGEEFGSFGAQAGLRLEQALTTFDLKTTSSSFDNDYFSIFPSAFISYRPIDAIQLKASYSKRINRPWTHALNPFISQSDPTFRQIGNPNLKPEYIHSFEFGITHTTDLTTVTLTPFFRRTVDVIRRYGTLDSNGVATATFRNFDRNDNYGADLIGSIRLGEKLSAFASFSAFQTVTDPGSSDQTDRAEGFVWTARANVSFQIIPGLDAQMSWFYRAPQPIEGGGRVGSFSSGDFALQQKLFDNRGRLGLRVSDPFNQMGFNIQRADSTGVFSFERKPQSRTLYLTFSYSFGSQERRAQRRPGTQQQPDMDTGGW